MPLFCDLGWHRVDPIASWNNGYYFSRCLRCGRDLVRTAYGRWHEPQGFRVVWRPTPPPGLDAPILAPADPVPAPVAEPVPAPPAAAAASVPAPPPPEPEPEPEREPEPVPEPEPVTPEEPVTREVPVEPVLPEEPEAPEASEPPEPEEPPSPFGPSRIPDFMGDAPPPPPRVTASGRMLPPEPEKGPIERDAGIERSVTQLFGTIFARRSSKPGEKKADPAEPVEARTGVPEVAGWVSFGCAVAIAFGLFALFAVDPPAHRQPEQAPTPRASAAAAAPSLYVSAALLNCRAAPSLQAERVRRIERGEQVALIAEEGEWISIAHGGRQCWAQAKYLASVQPL